MKNSELEFKSHPLLTSDHLQRKAVIYIRQSSEEQVQKNTGSTDYQRGLAEVARSYGWLRIETVDEDLGRSGPQAKGRTGWKRLQVMVAAKEVGAVFVTTLSRLSRQVLDLEIFRRMAEANDTLLYTDGRFVDPADSNDIIFTQFQSMLASFENRVRVRVMSQARMTKSQAGRGRIIIASWLDQRPRQEIRF